MAKTIKFRRRTEKKTDYKARLALLKSGLPRLVIRKTNKYIIAEIIKSKEAQDSMVCYANSKELKKLGWNLSCKNIPASYLTGFIIGTKGKKNSITKVIIDIGLQRSTKGSKIYAVVKGAADAGLNINYSKDIVPNEKRIQGEHIKKDNVKELVEKIKEKIK